MKKLLLLVASIVMFFSLPAQLLEGQPLLKNMQQAESKSESIAAPDYRLIGISSSENNSGIWEKGDSIGLEYSGTRGSDIVENIIDYDVFTQFNWDGFIYTPTDRDLRTYDVEDKVEEEKNQSFNGATWDDDNRSLFTYNASGQLETSTFQNYNGGSWENSSRSIYTYTGGNEESRTSQNWNGSGWDNNYRYVYTYDGDNNRTQQLYQDWNGSAWDDQSRRVYSYDQDDNMVQELNQDWSGSNWEDDWRYNMQYDNEGWLTSRTRQSWNGSTWENQWRELYSHTSGVYYYDEIISQDYTGGSWENDYKSEYQFTSFNKISEFISYDWDGTLWQGDLKQITYYEQYDNGISGGIAEMTDLGIKVYPNPASNYIQFKDSDSDKNKVIEIYSIDGKLITVLQGTGNITWYADGSVSKGLYNYVIKEGDKQQAGQLIIQ